MNSHTNNLYRSIDERIHVLTKLKDPFFHKTLEKIIITLGNNIKHNSPVLIFGNGAPQLTLNILPQKCLENF